MSLPQIAISYTSAIPSAVFDDFVQIVSAKNLDLHIETREKNGPYAGLEWLIPTAVIIFIGKAYFDTFLKEMGKDHYKLLKKGLKTFRNKLLGPAAPKAVVISANGKKSKDQQYFLIYSILAEGNNGRQFKLLIQRESSESEYEEIIDAYLDFLDAHHTHAIRSDIIENLKESQVACRTVLLAFNKETETIERINPIPIKLKNKT